MTGEVRSLNLANAASVVLYEGLRQLGLPAGVAPTFSADEAPSAAAARRRPRRGRRTKP